MCTQATTNTARGVPEATAQQNAAISTVFAGGCRVGTALSFSSVVVRKTSGCHVQTLSNRGFCDKHFLFFF